MARPLVLGDKLYIPKNRVSEEELAAGFERHLYKENGCARCPIYKEGDRFCDTCATCDNHLGFYKTWGKKKLEVNGRERTYYYVPSGYKEYINDVLGLNLDEEKIIDIRADVRADHPLTFTGKLYSGKETINGVRMANQKKLVKKFWGEKRGIIKSAPRTGKTVCFTRLVCAFKRRTLIVADETILLKQALRTIREHTNVRELEAETGRKLIGIIQFPEDWDERWDIVLCTYQKFIKKETSEKRIAANIKGQFGVVIVDEVHKAGAATFAKFINQVDSRYKFGVTATDKRKDGAEFLVEQILGPVVAENKSVSLIPRLLITETGLKPKTEWKGKAGYVYANAWLAKHKERNIEIVRQIFKDLRSHPRHSIVIPVMRIDQVKKLVKMINRQAEINREKRGEDWGDQLARPYYGTMSKKQQEETIAAARKNRGTRVVVAFRTKVEKGVDVKPWSIMYLTFPMNNDTNFYQMTQRICTPDEGKPSPILRMFVDEFGLSKGCFTATYFGSIKKYKYKIDDETDKIAKRLVKRRIGPNADIGDGPAHLDW